MSAHNDAIAAQGSLQTCAPIRRVPYTEDNAELMIAATTGDIQTSA
jgi:hypothetical protein